MSGKSRAGGRVDGRDSRGKPEKGKIRNKRGGSRGKMGIRKRVRPRGLALRRESRTEKGSALERETPFPQLREKDYRERECNKGEACVGNPG